jgi:hypothetical protein
MALYDRDDARRAEVSGNSGTVWTLGLVAALVLMLALVWGYASRIPEDPANPSTTITRPGDPAVNRTAPTAPTAPTTAPVTTPTTPAPPATPPAQ